MSELKAISGLEIREDIDYNTRGIDPENKEWCNYGKELCDTLYYRKSEADKVISELKADYKEACDRLQNANLIKDEQLAAARHNKYKRCLAMARWCKDNADWWNYEQINRLHEQRGNDESFRFKEAHNRFCFFCQMERALAGTCRELQGGEVMDENTRKFEIKIDPLDFHVGLKDKMAEFESLIRMENPGKKIAEHVEKDLKSRFCHCCFFGHVECELMGEPLCKECAKILYGFDADEERPSIKKIDPYYQLWYRRKKALPIFEAYLHAELERFKLEQKLAEDK